ncbi:hypothetical protein G4Y79_02420 [Phototrophicus methaneseepsis]|uniref:Uncharacterized protein n=1 Tax=Phototrophicus methaneseepsis TaxID=2710758 RepID=A0A7S8IF55_9CHLR|nr:hypothetical protein [Phototrophicus methaneseepsis]QPC83251.1 hypothetical protein G4Y79_02420 [Phototrophicus methaneseepsis]
MKRPQGLTSEERSSIKLLVRYALAIFGAVALTLVVVALVSSVINAM